ncbi:hypothetical protein M1P56_09775 [Streptomyces sp. HU2014]|uniref:hypothetical protein n=1 Tax=Streptomyces sp. HU2014 TaxID=2939414 RepID=UPI00200DD8C3|nr:hypothetical protein [Streptomyces sp. HU2014]UQI44614.1 hypothetical protein M1P56_09775 [Streptomyces sp. HU2014]
MSRIKTYAEDASEVEIAAGLAALQDTPRARLKAVTTAFELCGTLARKYHDSHTVAQMLVQHAAEAYRATRLRERLEIAA